MGWRRRWESERQSERWGLFGERKENKVRKMRIDRWLCWNLGNTSNLTAQVTFMAGTFNWAFYKGYLWGKSFDNLEIFLRNYIICAAYSQNKTW